MRLRLPVATLALLTATTAAVPSAVLAEDADDAGPRSGVTPIRGSVMPDLTGRAALLPTVAVADADRRDEIVPIAIRPPEIIPPEIIPPEVIDPHKGMEKIKHIVIIVQENRSFDHYFGTYPGAEGIKRKNGKFVPCVKDPLGGGCVRPYHDRNWVDSGGPHHSGDAQANINGGKMDGFLKRVVEHRNACASKGGKYCMPGTRLPDVMGFKTGREIPNYWTYAREFVLQDHMFEPVRSWSLPSHLWLVSGWSARCSDVHDPMSCTTAIGQPPKDFYKSGEELYAWTDITYMLYRRGISWRYYVADGTPADCGDGRMICRDQTFDASDLTPMIWNPLPYFTNVRERRQVDNVQRVKYFFRDLRDGKMAQVIWIMPNQHLSEHAPNGNVDDGQAWVTKVVNRIGRSKFWKSTAIFVTWDDWGGFYDHVVPPNPAYRGYGLRVPGLVISPYAKRGYIDKQILSFDAYLKFIEDRFLRGRRLDPRTLARPDSRPVVVENLDVLGDVTWAFDFTQKPREPLILDPHPGIDRQWQQHFLTPLEE
jgi:phospholipase C